VGLPDLHAAGVTTEDFGPLPDFASLSPGRLGGEHLPSRHGAPFREEPTAEAALKIDASVKRLTSKTRILLLRTDGSSSAPLWEENEASLAP